VFYEIDMPLIGVLLDIERTGMAVDCERLHDLGCSSGKEIDALKQTIYNLAGETFNIDSPKQLSHILFEVMGLPHAKKTTRGFSTNAKVLGDLAATEPIAAEVLRYRELAKIKSTYIDTLPKLRGVDGRIHTRLHQTVTTTGRLSSSDPNLQNIPVRSQFGKQIRESFVPIETGDVFVSADYSQIELRLLAHLSGDEHLIGAFLSGEDFHASTASRVFGVPQADVTPQMRSRSKAVNFGIVYGQQAFGLSQSLGISMAEAREMIERYFEAYPGVRAFLDRTIESAKEKGYAETMFGRRRYIPEFKSSNRAMRAAGERNAMNHPMQGSAADIIKVAMNRVARRLDAEGFKAKLIMQVHDELDFSVPQDEVEALSKMVKEVMEGAADLSVPLIAEIGVGSNWGEAH
jgi:DNA polymerase-1